METDDTLALADRVAGCLVLQYGQNCDEPGILGLRLGRDPLWLRPSCPRSCIDS